MGDLLKAVGLLVIIASLIGGLYLYIDATFEQAYAILILIVGVINGILIAAFGRVIELLQKISDSISEKQTMQVFEVSNESK